MWNAVLRIGAMPWMRPILEGVLVLASQTKRRAHSDGRGEEVEGRRQT